MLSNDKKHHPTLNTLGHRCDELEDVLGKSLDFKKYFIVLGDNAGLHMHQPVEETWPYLLAKETNHTYYNLCIINGGLEAVRYNLLTWLNKNHPPKYIFIACEWAIAELKRTTPIWKRETTSTGEVWVQDTP